jgi:hypothetical protein
MNEKTLNNNKFYFIQIGENDGKSWNILTKINNNYIYFTASCDYTGFDCRGGGSFGYSTN